MAFLWTPQRMAGCALLLAACGGGRADGLDAVPVRPDIAVTRAPFERIYVQFKETLGQAYVYVEHVGPYNDLRAAVRSLTEAAARRRIEPAGPIFALYEGDPRAMPTGTERARVCLPVSEPVAPDADLGYAGEPARTVVYAVVAGPFGSGQEVYDALYERMREWGWVQHGPLKEIYGFPAGGAGQGEGEFLTEVQIPWVPGR